MTSSSPTFRFQQLLQLTARRKRGTHELEPLLLKVYDSVNRRPASARAVHRSLIQLVEFLASPHGCQPQNFELVADFVLAENEWEMDWSYLPNPLEDVMFDLSSGAPQNQRPATAWPNDLLTRLQRYAP